MFLIKRDMIRFGKKISISPYNLLQSTLSVLKRSVHSGIRILIYMSWLHVIKKNISRIGLFKHLKKSIIFVRQREREREKYLEKKEREREISSVSILHKYKYQMSRQREDWEMSWPVFRWSLKAILPLWTLKTWTWTTKP